MRYYHFLPFACLSMQANPGAGERNHTTVYTNSFLATLNARQSLKGPVNNTSFMMMSLPTNGLSHISSGTTESRQQQSIAIRIDTTTEEMKCETTSVCPLCPFLIIWNSLMYFGTYPFFFFFSRWLRSSMRKMKRSRAKVTLSFDNAFTDLY